MTDKEEGATCQYTHCNRPIIVTKGHRPRSYCDDRCKVAAYRLRQEQAEREQHLAALREQFGGYDEKTLQLLDAIMQIGSVELAQRVAYTINAEAGKQVHASREAATRKVFDLQKQVKELEQEKEGLREKQRGRVDKMKLKTASDLQELEQARADLLRLYQSQTREQEEIHRLYVLAQDLQTSLGAARNRIIELEEKQPQVSEQNLQEYQQKLIQAGQRIAKLEGQVAVQRQRLGQYYQRVAELEKQQTVQPGEVRLPDATQ